MVATITDELDAVRQSILDGSFDKGAAKNITMQQAHKSMVGNSPSRKEEVAAAKEAIASHLVAASGQRNVLAAVAVAVVAIAPTPSIQSSLVDGDVLLVLCGGGVAMTM